MHRAFFVSFFSFSFLSLLTCARNVDGVAAATHQARSSDGGLHWEGSTTNLWGEDGGSRKYDNGMVAYQGPLLLQPNDAAFALYFTEFETNDGKPYDNTLPGKHSKDGGGVSSHRSMLQLARVRFNATSGWLHGNRSEPFVVHLQPPADAAPPPNPVLPTVLAVAKSEAATIALAEINRWTPLGSGP